MSLVRTLDGAVSGDEKPLRFTGNSGYIIAVKAKPARVELCFTSLWVVWRTGSPMSFIR